MNGCLFQQIEFLIHGADVYFQANADDRPTFKMWEILSAQQLKAQQDLGRTRCAAEEGVERRIAFFSSL
jgi:hypothetical protein